MALELTNVVKRYGEYTAVDDLSFSIGEPGVFGLLGTNGAGKTTTIRMILGILARDGGQIAWDGKPVRRETVRFGYLPEERGIYPKARIGEQLMYFARLRGMGAREAKQSLDYWYGRLGVAEYANRPAEQLSKGNQQKIQLISALVHDPELVILDEPFSGLDPVNTDLFKSVLQELIERGKYLIMSSHQMPAVEEYCRQILILKGGKTVLSGDLRQIKHGYGRTNLSVDCDGDLGELALAEGISIVSRTASGTEMKISSDEQAYRLLRGIMGAGMRLNRFEIREPSLHEIFVEKVGEQQ